MSYKLPATSVFRMGTANYKASIAQHL